MLFSSAMIWLFLILLAGILSWAVLRQGRGRARGRIRSLERRYLRQLHQPPRIAHETLTRTLQDMRQRYPDRSRTWHLKKMIADLERDRL